MRRPHAVILNGHGAPATMAPYWRAASWWRAIAYAAAIMPLLAVLALAIVYYDLNRTEVPDWRLLNERAQEAVESGNLLEARLLYLQVDRIAYWVKDWRGLVAAGCGISKLDGSNRSHSRARSILLRAATTAELLQSSQGLATVAKSFSMLGADEAALLVLARVEAHWPNEAAVTDDRVLLAGCAR